MNRRRILKALVAAVAAALFALPGGAGSQQLPNDDSGDGGGGGSVPCDGTGNPCSYEQTCKTVNVQTNQCTEWNAAVVKTRFRA